MKKQYAATTLQVVECQIRERIGKTFEDISGWSAIKPL